MQRLKIINMKTTRLLPLLLFFLMASCASVRVNSDYDKTVDFSQYKTYAFYKTGIDKVEISDLDKKRILRSIDEEMAKKGFTKSETPDLLVNINTKVQQNITVDNFYNGWGYGWGYGWNPYWGPSTMVSTSTDGRLIIDFIDAKKKELVWQGEGDGAITNDTNKKDQLIHDFVEKIISQYPPGKK